MGAPTSTWQPGCCSTWLWSHTALQPPGPQLASGLGPAGQHQNQDVNKFVVSRGPPRATVGHRLNSKS